jgi:hypothetical protein
MITIRAHMPRNIHTRNMLPSSLVAVAAIRFEASPSWVIRTIKIVIVLFIVVLLFKVIQTLD